MDRLGGQVRRELGRFGPGAGAMPAIVRAWPGAVGPTIARNAWPARVSRDGTLHVNAVSATWAFELGRMAGEILDRLGAELGDDAPPALKVVPGPIPEPHAEETTTESHRRPEVGAEDRATAARLASSIEDEELRGLVARAAAASLARARASRAF